MVTVLYPHRLNMRLTTRFLYERFAEHTGVTLFGEWPPETECRRVVAAIVSGVGVFMRTGFYAADEAEHDDGNDSGQ